ncbi:MAG: Fic family protein [Elusimicrobia bacterium]|nr:Fic family protein [Elusimicrobiota bacterium]
MEFQTLETQEVVRIHELLVDEFANTPNPIFPPGVKDMNMLSSAVSRQHAGFGAFDKYSTPTRNAATLTFGICCNHPFHNGNKRTALVSLLAHLEKNRLTIRGTSHKELEAMIINIATHSLINTLHPKQQTQCRSASSQDTEVAAIDMYLKERVDTVKRGERPITYRRLEEILKKHGYGLKNQDGRHIDIIKFETHQKLFSKKIETTEHKIGSISFQGTTATVSPHTIKQTRRFCGLREEDGHDSTSFYDDEAVIDSFINTYRKILHRLANK